VLPDCISWGSGPIYQVRVSINSPAFGKAFHDLLLQFHLHKFCGRQVCEHHTLYPRLQAAFCDTCLVLWKILLCSGAQMMTHRMRLAGHNFYETIILSAVTPRRGLVTLSLPRRRNLNKLGRTTSIGRYQKKLLRKQAGAMCNLVCKPDQLASVNLPPTFPGMQSSTTRSLSEFLPSLRLSQAQLCSCSYFEFTYVLTSSGYQNRCFVLLN
jgi:hypothetical protein